MDYGAGQISQAQAEMLNKSMLNAAAKSHWSKEEYLQSLALRENTVIDNPYQQSQINQNWTRDQMQIQALDQHRGTTNSTAVKDIDEVSIKIS